jgi:hypothetical protein
MSPTRRQLLLAGAGGVTALAGCSALTAPRQSLLVAVNNYTDSRHEGRVLVENDGTELVRQYVEAPAAEPAGWATVETKVDLGRMPDDTPLNVSASFGDDLEASGQHTLECSETYAGDAVYVQIENETPPNLRLNLACYDEFPSSEARQGGVGES